MRMVYVAGQKEDIRQEVLRVVDMIEYQHSLSEKRTKDIIKKRVYEAHAVAQHLYEKNKGIKSASEIQQMIIDALGPIKFEEDRGYFFISRLDGVAVLFPSNPDFVGVNLINGPDTNTQNITEGMLTIANRT